MPLLISCISSFPDTSKSFIIDSVEFLLWLCNILDIFILVLVASSYNSYFMCIVLLHFIGFKTCGGNFIGALGSYKNHFGESGGDYYYLLFNDEALIL